MLLLIIVFNVNTILQFIVTFIVLEKVSSSGEAIDFLLEIEKSDRNSIKRVVLDCPPNMAKVEIRLM